MINFTTTTKTKVMKINHKKNAKFNILSWALYGGMTLLSTASFFSAANYIAEDKVIADIRYLASDDLKGRASFTADIDNAANYIEKRFKEIGLNYFNHSQSFKQTFNVVNITPSLLTVTLNGKPISADKLAMATTMAQFSWHKPESINTHVVNETDDLRQLLRTVNKQGGQHLVLANNKHQDMFSRYQSFFQRGLTKLDLNGGGAIVIVLTNDSEIDAIDVVGQATINTQSLTNIVGIIPGQKKPDEMVLFSSHYDHLGVDPRKQQDQIYNGADDNASGTTAVINIADYYAKKGDNARTLVFSAFTAEEIGGFGSQYFSQQLDANNVVAMLNIEMIGKPSKFGAGTLWMTGRERSNLGDMLNQALSPYNQEIHTDPYPEQDLFYRSDNATLARLGVPAHSFSSTQLDKDQHYHQVSDDLESLDLNSMHQVIKTLAISTQRLVDGSVTPSRVDVSQIREQGKIY